MLAILTCPCASCWASLACDGDRKTASMSEFKVYLGDPHKLEKVGFAAIQADLKALFKAALGKDANVVVERASMLENSVGRSPLRKPGPS